MEFALNELKKYASIIGIDINIGLFVDLSVFDTTRFFRFEQKYDDAFEIKVKNGNGTIKATNERAVLIGVYHYLKCQGCRFLKPGKDGEYIPHRDTALDVDEIWYAKVRHRGSTSMAAWNAFTGFDAYAGGTYSTGAIAADTAIVVTVAALADSDIAGVATEVATLPSVFAPAADTAVTFGKVLDSTNATSWGVELTKDGVGVTPYHGGSYLYKANATNANGQYAIEFVGLASGTYQIRTYIYVDGVAVFGAPTTFVVD